MAEFIPSGTAGTYGAVSGTNFPKSDATALPAGTLASQAVVANDWNIYGQALTDIRNWWIGAPAAGINWYGFKEGADPAPANMGGVGQPAYLWANSSDHKLHVKQNNVDISLGVGTIGGSIATNQVAFGSGSNTISGSANITWNDTNRTLSLTGTGSNDTLFLTGSSLSLTANPGGYLFLGPSTHMTLNAREFRTTQNSATDGMLFGSGRDTSGALGSDAYAPSTAVNQSHTTFLASFTPSASSPSFAELQVNPTINGTSSGTAYGVVIASKTNTLTGGTIKLISGGQTTTDAFTGYTEKFSFDINGRFKNANSSNEATTATAGANGAPPAQVVGYVIFTDSGGTTRKIPYYAN